VQKIYGITGFGGMRFRFQFVSDGDSTTEGAYIDDILIRGVPSVSDGATEALSVVELSPGASPEGGQISGDGTRSEAAISASSFSLRTYPNPFNVSTVASFELRVPSWVSLKVHDTAGRLVATLVDGWREAGTHDATFDGSGLASGLYFVRMEAGDFREIKKLVLLK
jgi:hypothetical protein